MCLWLCVHTICPFMVNSPLRNIVLLLSIRRSSSKALHTMLLITQLVTLCIVVSCVGEAGEAAAPAPPPPATGGPNVEALTRRYRRLIDMIGKAQKTAQQQAEKAKKEAEKNARDAARHARCDAHAVTTQAITSGATVDWVTALHRLGNCTPSVNGAVIARY